METTYYGDDQVPIKSWCPNIEEGAFDQATNLAKLPFLCQHVALMPDCHQGYGMPIGGVMAAHDVIIPNAVGVDIGCGMFAVKSNLIGISKTNMKRIMGIIRDIVPMGRLHQDKPCDPSWMPRTTSPLYIAGQEYESARRQMGTLGGGNHFIEIQEDDEGAIWFMIHSGSRNLGHKIATHYNKAAIRLNEQWRSSVPKTYDLAFLPLGTKKFEEYLAEMTYAVDFARQNRRYMAESVEMAFKEILPSIQFDFARAINIAHNYAALENHFGKNVWVHRKGATKAHEGQLGIIPGSQGTSSFIVTGKGNMMSFNSCSHGAGRAMGRKAATRNLDFEQQLSLMGDVIHGMRTRNDLDEAPGSYKDIHDVMLNQRDLVKIFVELKPLAVLKA